MQNNHLFINKIAKGCSRYYISGSKLTSSTYVHDEISERVMVAISLIALKCVHVESVGEHLSSSKPTSPYVHEEASERMTAALDLVAS